MVRTRSGRMVEVPSNEALRNKKRAAATKSTPPASLQWERLPSLVQEEVLKELAEDYNRHSLEDRRRRAGYAAVSLQWQEFFEQLNFKKLVIRPSALKDFGNIVKRRSHIKTSGNRARKKPRTSADASSSPSRMPRIRHIWLSVELLPYGCGKCKLPEEPKEKVKNNVIFTQAIWKLLNILSGWEKLDSNQDLTLELSAHSPSDAHHCFQDDAGLQNDYPNLDPIRIQRDFIMQHKKDITGGVTELNDLFHGFFAGQYNSISTQTRHYPEAIADRLIRPLEFDFFGIPSNKHRLPEVKMISCFIVRRQFYRELRPETFGQMLRESLTGLRKMRYERWRLPEPLYQKMYEMEFGPVARYSDNDGHNFPVRGTWIFQPGFPSLLETLSLFEETSSKSPDPKHMSGSHEADIFQISRIQVLDGLAGLAVHLKHLSVSFLSDALDCFEFPDEAFPNLQSLAMTSRDHLQPTYSKVKKVSLAAAKACTKLPKLQIMELWNCEDGHAAILRYEATTTMRSGTCELTWRCSWGSTIGADVVKAWGRTAHKASRRLTFVLDPLPPDAYSKYGAILRHLRLRDFILDPVSAMQAQAGIVADGLPEVPAWRASMPYSPVWSHSAGPQD